MFNRHRLLLKLLQSQEIYLASKVSLTNGLTIPVVAVQFQRGGKVALFQESNGDLIEQSFELNTIDRIVYR